MTDKRTTTELLVDVLKLHEKRLLSKGCSLGGIGVLGVGVMGSGDSRTLSVEVGVGTSVSLRAEGTSLEEALRGIEDLEAQRLLNDKQECERELTALLAKRGG